MATFLSMLIRRWNETRDIRKVARLSRTSEERAEAILQTCLGYPNWIPPSGTLPIETPKPKRTTISFRARDNTRVSLPYIASIHGWENRTF